MTLSMFAFGGPPSLSFGSRGIRHGAERPRATRPLRDIALSQYRFQLSACVMRVPQPRFGLCCLELLAEEPDVVGGVLRPR